MTGKEARRIVDRDKAPGFERACLPIKRCDTGEIELCREIEEEDRGNFDVEGI